MNSSLPACAADKTRPAGDALSGLDAEGYPRIGYAWYVVGVLLVAAITSYLDRYLISLLVEPINESSSYSTLNYLDWTLQVRVAVVLRGDAPDQLADPILVSLHSLLMTDRSLGNRANDISPVSVDYRFADGDQAIAVIESIYSVSYRTKQDDLTVGG